ncbi:vacuolar protein sorting-associated protein 62 domain-containing protein [Sarocladium implicatum]|nr:vacuolar protein sorting-associated protein 62 domain-containing protein [Sarocladium implicatum]
MYWFRRISIIFACVVAFSFAAWAVPNWLNPTDAGPEQRARDRRWVNSSPYFLDRQACRWVGLCGLHHLRRDPAKRGHYEDVDDDDEWDGDELRLELKRRVAPTWERDGGKETIDKRRNVKERRKILKEVPDYVLKHAPLVHLYSGEEFWPSDIKNHVAHMTVYHNNEPLNDTEQGIWDLHNLHHLNKYGRHNVLRSDDDVESRPSWLHSHDNIPNPFENDDGSDRKPPVRQGEGRGPKGGEPSTWFDIDKDHPLHRISDPRLHPKAQRLFSRGSKPDKDGYSQAPAILILVDKGSGIIDAFWFFFYSYNLGQTVLGVRFGNHVGDWEHCMIRFEHGVPRGMYLSEHEGGQAYAWEAFEKRGPNASRPVIFSAVGSHAMYALPGEHPYVLPFAMLRDVTDRGPLWDPALNNYAYHYDYLLDQDQQHRVTNDTLPEAPASLTPAAKNPDAPTSWFHYRGRWGDEVYSLADPRQWRFFGQYHYVTGPNGPWWKQLARSKLCQAETCKILYGIDPDGTWY